MKAITKTCKAKLNIPEEQIQDILETFRQYNYALNFAVEQAWKPERKIINKSKLHKLTYYPLREKTNLPANFICSARNKACDVIRGNIIKWYNHKKATKPIFKPFSAIQFDKRTLTIKNRYCTFSTVKGRVNANYFLGDYQKQILDDPNYEFRTATLTYKNGNFFLNMTIVKPALIKKPETVMGIDLGIKNIAVTSTGKFFKSGLLNDSRRQFREKRAKLQSKGTRSCKKVLQRLSGRETSFNNWVLHNISRQIVNEAINHDVQVIVFEKLTDIRESVKQWRKEERVKVNLWAFSKLQQYTQYKAFEAGINTVFVEAEYTSQRCSKCGHMEAANRNGFNFVCKGCPYSLNADFNASKNIAIKVLSGKSPDWIGLPSKLALKTKHFAYV
ncbi:MAG: hypothetical protein DDT40_01003 [candidate division WS2 bacterium]|nr:hypothetical protein [Candidatus Psychracetigena formicireducens]